MRSQNGIWLYRSIERQGSYRLVLAAQAGKLHAQRQRFNADGTSLPLQSGDIFVGEKLDDVIEWLNKHHLHLTLRGWNQVETAGVAKVIQLCSDTARRHEAKRIRALRGTKAARNSSFTQPQAACA